MNEELTNEAAELIGRYTKRGKAGILSALLERGGITRKEVEPSSESGRKEGSERIFYYYPDGGYACYDPVRAKAAERRRKLKS